MKIKLFLLAWWCLIASLLLSASSAAARMSRRDAIDEQLSRIRNIQDDTGIQLENNQDWHDWIIANSKQRMPRRLEIFYAKLNR